MSKSVWGKARTPFADTEPASTLPMALAGEEQAYADTVPQPLVRSAARAAIAPRQGGTVHDLMALIRKDNRVCPQPGRWEDFYRLLRDLSEGAALPSPPLVGEAWKSTPDVPKRMCFCEQVEWAAANNCLIAAYTFLKVLPENDWHYAV